MDNKKTEILKALTIKYIKMIKSNKLNSVQGGGSCTHLIG